MKPRASVDIVIAALRWQMAREVRLAAGAEKRRADVAYKARCAGDATAKLEAVQWSLRADAAVAEARRQERAAVRTLAKACARARSDLQSVDVPPAVLEAASCFASTSSHPLRLRQRQRCAWGLAAPSHPLFPGAICAAG